MRVRIRRIAKWGCLSLGSVMLIAAIAGYWWYAGYSRWSPSTSSGTARYFDFSTNGISIGMFSGPAFPFPVSGWGFQRFQGPMRYVPAIRNYPFGRLYMVPLSNVAVLMLSAGAALWRLDRRRAAHECRKCRYDLRGLAEGAICPECGGAPPPQPPSNASAPSR